MRETMELEKTNAMHAEDLHCTTSNDDAVEDQQKPIEIKEPEQKETESPISILIDVSYLYLNVVS